MGTGRFEQLRGRSAKKMGILGERRRDSGVCFSPAEGLAGGLGSCLVPCGVRNSPENSWMGAWRAGVLPAPPGWGLERSWEWGGPCWSEGLVG